jgi:hypothetical protein
MITYGKNINGETISLGTNVSPFLALSCGSKNLVEINLPKDIIIFDCYNNHITKLDLPNTLTTLVCYDNPIKELTLPKNIKYAVLPLNCIVTNLDEFRKNKKIKILFL